MLKKKKVLHAVNLIKTSIVFITKNRNQPNHPRRLDASWYELSPDWWRLKASGGHERRQTNTSSCRSLSALGERYKEKSVCTFEPRPRREDGQRAAPDLPVINPQSFNRPTINHTFFFFFFSRSRGIKYRPVRRFHPRLFHRVVLLVALPSSGPFPPPPPHPSPPQ